ncbi:hypothetical protein J7T55_006851 [Diaporthe amygdali]|uniref:uncharacterized protein n=1 Tax=Phomopsis amygdali TaxID=1214568 RepID=UPI0022FE6829|nr:uncharacterized protein J7T55_006851 [Diaporthe amygdali]KAJ0125502.1 hypothetical protein J7T55_006851 [Diaporthe amygdali]
MSQPASAGVRRNPRRSTTRATSRPRNPTGRVTRSATRLPSPSSDSSGLDDDSDDSSANEAPAPRPRRTLGNQTTTRQSARLQTIAHHRQGSRASQRTRAAVPAVPPSSRPRRAQPSPRSRTPSRPAKNRDSASKVGGARKKLNASRSASNEPGWPSSKVCPPWQHLEWTILVQILEYASSPLETKEDTRWLLSAGLTCKLFLGPALKALYRRPIPILSMNMANKFAALMHNLAENHAAAKERDDHRRTMVESLVVSVTTLSTSKPFDLGELIQLLPSLSHLELYHEFDLPPYRQLDSKSKKWTYSQALVSALRSAGDAGAFMRLKSWRWSERMMDRDVVSPEQMKSIHQWPTFSQLREVAFVNFQVPSLKENKDPTDPDVFEADKNFISCISESLQPLECLKHLKMESSTVVDGQFLSLLPKTIEHLEIVNCWELTAEMLSEYLFTHGRNIRRLTLHHNQSLSLAFLPFLAGSCPQLRELSMHLTYYAHHEYYNDSDPFYETLLTVTDVPAWPQTIEVIDLEQLAKWDAATAEMFFQSFVDQAPQMPRLRCLAVKAMLDVPWRQRCEFRDRWVGRLRRVFLRKQTKPQPYHSLVQWPSLNGGPAAQEATTDVEASTVDAPTRRSTRIATHVAAPAPLPVETNQEDRRKRKRTAGVARDLRRPKRVAISYRDPDTDEDLDLLEPEESEEEEPEEPSPPSTPPESPPSPGEDVPFVHGLCDVVNIRFDNQKPREFQLGMEDFLDEEEHESDDDEWTSDRDRDDDSDVYAW